MEGARPIVAADFVFLSISTSSHGELLELAAVVLDARGFWEKESFASLVRSDDVAPAPADTHGITADMARSAPPFTSMAPTLHALLHNRVWVGHDTPSFAAIISSFRASGRAAPEPVAVLDMLVWLQLALGPRVADATLGTLAYFFGHSVGEQRRAAAVRTAIAVVKSAAAAAAMQSFLMAQAQTRRELSFEQMPAADAQNTPPATPNNGLNAKKLTASAPAFEPATQAQPSSSTASAQDGADDEGIFIPTQISSPSMSPPASPSPARAPPAHTWPPDEDGAREQAWAQGLARQHDNAVLAVLEIALAEHKAMRVRYPTADAAARTVMPERISDDRSHFVARLLPDSRPGGSVEPSIVWRVAWTFDAAVVRPATWSSARADNDNKPASKVSSGAAAHVRRTPVRQSTPPPAAGGAGGASASPKRRGGQRGNNRKQQQQAK